MRNERVQLFLASFLMLFVELVLIRWVGAYIVYLSYFANIILLGSFLGIGVGFLRAHKEPDLFGWAPTLLALFAGLVIGFPVTIDRTGGDLVYFGVQQEGLPAWLMLPFVFLATTAVMATIAHGVAVRFRGFEALEAYRLDILGSIAGIVTFSALTLTGFGPIAWGVVIVGLFLALLPRPSALQVTAWAALLVVFAIGTFRGETIWSPYQRLVVMHLADTAAIDANGVPHQAGTLTAGTAYELPYRRMTHRPERVLIIGAGNGNDVSTALREGAKHVDAVEIDPEIQRIGMRYHPERPYDDPRVTRINDDGRAFLARSESKYDLIVLALPDSLTLVTGQSGVRLESYLFTQEALEDARDHLAPGGVFAMYNFYREQWLADRLAGTANVVFGSRPCFEIANNRTEEPGVGKLNMFFASTDPTALVCGTTWDPEDRVVVAPAMDDRPFLYLRDRMIPGRYLLVMALLLGATAVVVRGAGGPLRPMANYADLFLMGVAFLLLETKSVVQFALLFGTTWFVNALVFGSVLVSVLLAIEVERRVRIARGGLLFGLLLVALVVAWFVPTQALLDLTPALRLVVAGAVAFVPIFLANLIFAERFRDTDDPTAAFGANLVGAMVGGTLEYVSLVTGYRTLLVVVGILYVTAWLVTPKGQQGAR